MFTLTENKITRLWEDKEICFGDAKYCTNKLSGEFERYILSFGEDEGGIIIHYIQFYIIQTYCCEIDWKHSPKEVHVAPNKVKIMINLSQRSCSSL